MQSRSSLATAFVALVSSTLLLTAAHAGSLSPAKTGLQLYSLRAQFAKDVPGTLAEVKSWGVKNVELAGTYNLAPAQFKAQLDAYGLDAISGHFGFDQFRTDLDGIVRDAKILGLKYVGCAWIPHGEKFDEKTCRDAIEVFNRAGAVLAKNGFKFFYHTHGYEFQPFEQSTLFDLLMKETDPKTVHFEMDIFWIAHAGRDPVQLMKQYPHRWALMHLKGMRDSTPTGLLTGGSDVNNDVAVGQGKIAFPPLLRAAAKEGVKYYFIEDESPVSEQQIPVSLDYLRTVKW